MKGSLWFGLSLLSLAYCALDNRGTKFVVAFLDNLAHRNDISPELFVTTASHAPVHVHVTSPGSKNPSIRQSFVVTRGVVHKVAVDPHFRLNHTELVHKAIRITADAEITVYGVNRETASDDVYLALPTDVLGTEYYTISHTPAYYYCVFAVISIANGTQVSIQLPNHDWVKVTYNNHVYNKNDWINVTMDKFQTFQISSVGDLTGSHVISSHPVGVISGNKKTIVGHTGGSRDHLTEMLMPVQAWGKNFATVPIPERTVGDEFRFVASKDNTQINVTGRLNGTIFHDNFTIPHAGDYVQKSYSSSLYSHVKANEPIAVYQFSKTQAFSKENIDPSMITVPPIEQYGNDYTFTTPEYSNGQYLNQFMFVIKSHQKGGLLLDGHPLPHNQKYVHIPGTHMVGGYVNITVGTHTVTHTNPNITIGGILFGRAHVESYGFPIGFLVKPINPVNHLPATTSPTPTCDAPQMRKGDEVDNDCDGSTDEEDCDGKDNDGDGRIDEDCSGQEFPIIG
ncbi:uncharacterized protein LOC130051889 isoform X2 [Ostrea edulis]|uniref:uncharacterized protein LOC130051889 isoform X2 n=1 Tax=Ostrea edulis TaxID=37623 RepID=UPI0024AFF40E|nr:uncharacterized protein LOC130051889 isoform X2 [Ostrea edulis]